MWHGGGLIEEAAVRTGGGAEGRREQVALTAPCSVAVMTLLLTERDPDMQNT
jgi:hypothetical protein